MGGLDDDSNMEIEYYDLNDEIWKLYDVYEYMSLN